jgi:hypothetical protein
MSNYPLQFNDTADTDLRPCGSHWRGVFFDGPQSDQNHDGDEIPAWFVYVGDEEAEPVATVYKFHDFTAAEELAKSMSHDRRLELVHEANPD